VAAVPTLRPGPRARADYPSSLGQFLDWFHTDEDCARYLARLRWSDGFSCQHCGPSDAWLTKRDLYVCATCGRQTSVIAGTVFEKTRLPLLTWFRAIWMLTSSKSGVSAKELERELGIGYRAAWLMLQKLRRAMVRPGRDQDRLSGEIEVDESYLGGPVPGGKRGRGAEGKVIIAVAVERKGVGKKSKRWKLGRTRIQVIPDTSAKALLDFVEDTCEQGSTIRTDGLQNAVAMRKMNYEGIVLLRKGQAGKRRGRKRTRPYSRSAITNTPAPRGSKAATMRPAREPWAVSDRYLVAEERAQRL
jgi:transposase-like protein